MEKGLEFGFHSISSKYSHRQFGLGEVHEEMDGWTI